MSEHLHKMVEEKLEEKLRNLNLFVIRLRDLLSRPVAPATVESIAKDLYFIGRDLEATASTPEGAELRRVFATSFEDIERFRKSIAQGNWNFDRLMLFREKLMTLAARVDGEILRLYTHEALATAHKETQQLQQHIVTLQSRLQSADVDVRLLKGRVAQLTSELQQAERHLTLTRQQLSTTTETLRQRETRWAETNQALSQANAENEKANELIPQLVEDARNRATRIAELLAEKNRLAIALEEAENARRLVEEWNAQQAERIQRLERSRDNLRAKLEATELISDREVKASETPYKKVVYSIDKAQEVVNQKEVNQEEVNQEEVNQKDGHQKEVNQKEVNQEEVNQEEVNQEEGHPKNGDQKIVLQEKGNQEIVHHAPPVGDLDLLEQLSTH